MSANSCDVWPVKIDTPEGWMRGIDRIAEGEDLGHPAYPNADPSRVNEWFLSRNTQHNLSVGRRKSLINGRRLWLVGPGSTMCDELPSMQELAVALSAFTSTEEMIGNNIISDGCWYSFSIKEG